MPKVSVAVKVKKHAQSDRSVDEFADRLLRSAKHLLDLYRWFGGTARRRVH